ncbi:polysaccharide lyase family 8 super-sandwich domain-containing protein [Paenibacillus rhizoplanae]
MVALGAGITSTNAAPVHTTLNQSLATGDVLVDGKAVDDGTSQVNGRWAYNDHTGYIFPDKTDFQVKQETKTGKWSDVVTGSSTEPITKPVFSMWLDHGVKPVNASYQYIVLPGKNCRRGWQLRRSKPDKYSLEYTFRTGSPAPCAGHFGITILSAGYSDAKRRPDRHRR